MKITLILLILEYFVLCFATEGRKDVWEEIPCNAHYFPENCDFDKISQKTVEDYERCAPARLPIFARNYYLGRSGRALSYKENFDAFRRIQIVPKMLLDISQNSLNVTILGQKIAFPVGLSPTSSHGLAHPEGERASTEAAVSLNTIMILSSYSFVGLEEVAQHVRHYNGILWMQIYIFKDRRFTVDIVRRAEKNGFKALVLTVDSSIVPHISCNGKTDPNFLDTRLGNFHNTTFRNVSLPGITTYGSIKWLKRITRLPIIAKGILTAEDARKAIEAGATAIFVSNHGGRQLDGVLATIDALPHVVKAVKKLSPPREVYMDGGVRNGWDVYKALAMGAKMVFIGRPVLYGLTMEGKEGVRNVLNILKEEFNTTMLLAGATNPSQIQEDTVIRSHPDQTLSL